MPDLDKILEDAVENPILSDAAEDIGKDLLQALIGELALIPDPTVKNQNVWSTRKEKDQEQTIHRLKDRVRSIVTKAFGQILAAGNPAAQAKLKDVKFGGEKITAGLEIDVHCKERHALADFAGKYIAVIMPEDTDEYFETMDEIVASKDQQSLALDTGTASDEAKPSPASDGDSGAQAEATGEAGFEPSERSEPNPEDIELFEALKDHGFDIAIEEIQLFSSEQRESTWNWVEGLEHGDAVDMPGFLVSLVDKIEPPKALGEMTKAELVAQAFEHADAIGEAATQEGDGGITEKQLERKTKPNLIDYIEYARGKLSEQSATASIDDTVGEIDTALAERITSGLKTVLGLDVDEETVGGWSDMERTEVLDYLDKISNGALPDRVPDVLGPYFSAD